MSWNISPLEPLYFNSKSFGSIVISTIERKEIRETYKIGVDWWIKKKTCLPNNIHQINYSAKTRYSKHQKSDIINLNQQQPCTKTQVRGHKTSLSLPPFNKHQLQTAIHQWSSTKYSYLVTLAIDTSVNLIVRPLTTSSLPFLPSFPSTSYIFNHDQSENIKDLGQSLTNTVHHQPAQYTKDHLPTSARMISLHLVNYPGDRHLALKKVIQQ